MVGFEVGYDFATVINNLLVRIAADCPLPRRKSCRRGMVGASPSSHEIDEGVYLHMKLSWSSTPCLTGGKTEASTFGVLTMRLKLRAQRS